MRLQPVKTGNLVGDLVMLNKDMEYKKYLDSVFEKTDEYYYINLETKEVVPSYISTNGIDGCCLYYIFKNKRLRNIQGEPIIEAEVNSVYNSFFHFGSRRLRKRCYQYTVYRKRIFGVGYKIYDTFDKYCRFTRTCGGSN